jgi:flagellar basal-body rod protein FlgB
MDLANMPLFSALARKMNWLTARQKVLADNIAHVDVPNYKASDLRPLDFRKELAQASHKLEVATTNPGHLTRTGAHQG